MNKISSLYGTRTYHFYFIIPNEKIYPAHCAGGGVKQKFTDKREVRRHRDCVICQICLKMAYLTVNEVK